MALLANLLTTQPWIALLIAMIFVALWAWRRQKISLTTAIVWLVYCVYEYGMLKRIFCWGDCNIRIDLLLIYPLLMALSLYAMFRIVTVKKSIG